MFDAYVSKLSGNLMIITAVAVTAVLCVAGIYFFTGGDSDKHDIHAAVSSEVADLEGFSSFFNDFDENARATVHTSVHDTISSAEDIQTLLSAGNTAVMTLATMDHVPGTERITIDGIHVFYSSAEKEGMEAFFINWLIGLSV